MDSLTQAALGATVGHAILGKHIGRAAPIVGAMLGTLPDLDVLISFGGVVEDFTYHRSFSHSLIVQLAFAPLLTWLILKARPGDHSLKVTWLFTVLAILWTHSLLDACTVYGTQLFWPIWDYPLGMSSVFIIDPMYTLPLLIAIYIAYKAGWQTTKASKATMLALLVSTFYLGWGVIAKSTIDHKALSAFSSQSTELNKISATLSTPLPFNSLLWRVIIMEDHQYHVAHIALWEAPEEVEFKSYDKGKHLLAGIEDEWDVQRLEWFTKGFYRAAIRDKQIVISDLRMGVEGSYAFNFAVAKLDENLKLEPLKAERIDDKVDWKRLALLWDRLWDASISLHPRLNTISQLN